MFTSMFLHVNLLHLVGNLIFLWIFGNNIEDRLGRLWFIGFYFAGGIIAVVTQVLIDPTSEVPMIGASGAISAVLGAYLVLFPGREDPVARLPRLLLPADRGSGGPRPRASGSCSSSSTGSRRSGLAGAEGGVAFFAHIGGFVAGVGMGLLYRAIMTRRGRWSGLPRAGVG